MLLDLDRLRDEQPRLYTVVFNHTALSSGTHDLNLDGLPAAIRFELAQESLQQEWKESAPKQPKPPDEPETLRAWQLPLDATEAQIRKASFLVRRDLAKRQHEAAVKENRRVLGSHSVKF